MASFDDILQELLDNDNHDEIRDMLDRFLYLSHTLSNDWKQLLAKYIFKFGNELLNVNIYDELELTTFFSHIEDYDVYRRTKCAPFGHLPAEKPVVNDEWLRKVENNINSYKLEEERKIKKEQDDEYERIIYDAEAKKFF